MAIQGLRGVVEAAIQRASTVTGVDFSFLMGTAARESGYNPRAKAATSSAAGLFQFVDQTWLATLKRHGAKYGYARYAEMIEKGADGRYHVAQPAARQAVMDLKLDPNAASLMAGELTSDHAAYLKGRVGRSPTAGELYVAHFLGPQGSARLIEANQRSPGAVAAALFPDAAQANKPIFYQGGRAATVAEVYANLTRAHGASQPAPARTQPPAAVEPPTDEGFVQYATARNLDRKQQEAALVDLILRGSQSADSPSRATGSLFTSEMLRVLSEAKDRS